MPVARGSKNYFSFAKGYITEATPLTFPENSVKDIDNVDINTDGSAVRRLGIDYEVGYINSSTIVAATTDLAGMHIGEWTSVGSNPNLRFAVIQINNTLYFHNMSLGSALSLGTKAFTVNLTSFRQPNVATVGAEPVQIESAKGKLFVVSNEINPFFITYTASTDTITATSYAIKIRDFAGLPPTVAADAHTSGVLLPAVQYNLFNQGWDIAKINAYSAFSGGAYPSNAQQWFIGKDSNENFSPDDLLKTDFGNTPAPKGRYILDAFIKDRFSASGIGGTVTEPTTSRPSTILFYAGRVLHAGSEPGVIYISPIIQSDLDYGLAYQAADPTSEQISDLIASDGIHLKIPECGSILKLVAIRAGVLIFANNGVWQLQGDNGPFTAVNQQVIKITDIAALGAKGICLVEGVPAMVTDGGIYTLEPDKVTSLATPVNLTLGTIQTYYNSVSGIAKANSTLVYNQYDKVLVWLHNTSGNYDGITKRFQYNGVLLYSVRLSSFTKYSFTSSTSYPHVVGAITPPTSGTNNTAQTIVIGADTVQVIGTDVVISTASRTSVAQRFLFLTLTKSGANYTYTFSDFHNTTFKDWVGCDAVGINYTSYLEAANVVLDNAIFKKETPYLYCYFKRTETAFVNDGSGNVVFDYPSSCKARIKWDFADDVASGRYSSQQQVYRFNHQYVPGGIGTSFTNGLSVTTTKTKFRGRGKVFSVRFDSEDGKDFQLIGYATTLTVQQAS